MLSHLIDFLKAVVKKLFFYLSIFAIIFVILLITISYFFNDIDPQLRSLSYLRTQYRTDLNGLQDQIDQQEAEILEIKEKLKAKAQNPELEIFFPSDSYLLSSDHQLALMKLILELDPDQELIIFGYADEAGTLAYNDQLSLKRAKEVQNFLLSKSPSIKINKIVGLGEKNPKYDNTSQASGKNRRVSIVKLTKPKPEVSDQELLFVLKKQEIELKEYKYKQEVLLKEIEKLNDKIDELKPNSPTVGNIIWNWGNWLLSFLASFITIFLFWSMRRKKKEAND